VDIVHVKTPQKKSTTNNIFSAVGRSAQLCGALLNVTLRDLGAVNRKLA